MTSAAPVSTRLVGRVLLVTIDHPPVNAIDVRVRRGLCEAIDRAEADAEVAAVVLAGVGRNFLAGADIREFGAPRLPPLLGDVCDRIEHCAKPVVAVVQGAALGGGLEVALAAHYRVALAGAALGLPEVRLGLLPGAGGTQRLPRLVGVQAALDVMLSGRSLTAAEAQALGLVDHVVAQGDPLAVGLAEAEALLARSAPVRRTRDAQAALADRAANQAAWAQAQADTAKTARGLLSPFKILDAVQASFEQPFDEGQRLERQFFLDCLASPQRLGLVHAFFAEREVAKQPDARHATPRAVAHTGVVGGGTMGAGIAVALLDAGLTVTMVERDAASLARGIAHVEQVYDGLLAKRRLDEDGKAQRMARLHGALTYDALAQADLVIEAVFEDLAVKQAVFAALDRVCRPGAVLATNTSYLDIDVIAAGTSRPQDVLGLHFFSPAHVMKLLEIVVPARAAADVVATGFALAKALKKVAVRAGVCDGFIGNRILATYRQAVDYLLLDGASPYQIDRALRDFGMAMGPFQVADLAGGDIGWATRKRRAATRDARLRYVAIADRLCERGWFGQKTGRGWYVYAPGSRTGREDPEVLALADAERARAGVVPRAFADDEIVQRCLAAMANEGAQAVHEHIALRPLDVDVVFLAGYGFPRHRGGPMKHADQIGLPLLCERLRQWAGDEPHDAHFWQPSPLLAELAGRGASFDSLNTLPADVNATPATTTAATTD